MTLLIAVLMLVQAPVPQGRAQAIKAQVSRIDPGDSQSSLDAVSRLVELSAADSESVLSACRNLPDSVAFYREALRAEIESAKAAGYSWPSVRRITLREPLRFGRFVQVLADGAGQKTEWLKTLHGEGAELRPEIADLPLLSALWIHLEVVRIALDDLPRELEVLQVRMEGEPDPEAGRAHLSAPTNQARTRPNPGI